MPKTLLAAITILGLVGLPLAGGVVGGWVGEVVCDEPEDTFLRCIGHKALGASFGFVVGLTASLFLLTLLVQRYRARRRAMKAIDT